MLCFHQALEYNQLLTSQLDSQRQYFENLLHTARAEAERCATPRRHARALACAPRASISKRALRRCAPCCADAARAASRALCASRSARDAARAAEADRTEAMQRASASAADAKESDRLRKQLEKKLEDIMVRDHSL